MDKSTVTPALIALFGGLLGVFIGQTMTATTESDKLVRVKLEEAYFHTLALPQLANDLHSVVLEPVIQANYDIAVTRYEFVRTKYREGIARVVAVSDLYEPKLGEATQQITECGNKFVSTAAAHFLLRAELGGKAILHPKSYTNPTALLSLPESLNMMVALRADCDQIVDELKKTVISSMKDHL